MNEWGRLAAKERAANNTSFLFKRNESVWFACGLHSQRQFISSSIHQICELIERNDLLCCFRPALLHQFRSINIWLAPLNALRGKETNNLFSSSIIHLREWLKREIGFLSFISLYFIKLNLFFFFHKDKSIFSHSRRTAAAHNQPKRRLRWIEWEKTKEDRPPGLFWK